MIVSRLESLSDSKNDDELRSFEDVDAIIVAHSYSDDDNVKFFPLFHDDRELLYYKRTKLANRDVYSVIPAAIMYTVTFVTRSNLPFVHNFGPIFSGALAATIITIILYAVILIPLIIRHFSRSKNLSIAHMYSKKIMNSRLRQLMEKIVPITLSMSTGLYLYARVRAGQCEDISDIWITQSCNPFADSLSIPHDQTILCYLTPLLSQLLIKGAPFHVILLGWLISVSFISASLIHVKGWPELWTLLYSLFFLYLITEIERLMRISFLQNNRAVHHESDRGELEAAARNHSHAIKKVKYELLIVSLQAEKDKHEIESERARLRSLIGNVAHDLKTPLQSIGMSVELLRDDLGTSLRKYTMPPEIQNAVNLLTLESANVTLDRLTSMSAFMAMAINRCLDFTKASSGIVLVPSMETIHLSEALAIPVDCINNLQSDTTIVVNPIPPEVCQFIITDKHWLIENILCLLSNATKYSTCGAVNLILELDFQTHEFLSHKILRVTIEDSGIGIPNEARQKLFQPFTQAQRMTGGTGLGLYSLSKRMEALGGGYGVHDRRDGTQGSAFWISFPYRPDSMSMSKETCSPHVDTSPPDEKRLGRVRTLPTLTSLQMTSARAISTSLVLPLEPSKVPNVVKEPVVLLRILIVEDSLPIMKVVCQMLKQKGHEVESAPNGSLGLDRMIQCHSTNLFDVVLMDLQMPVMDGIEATRRYREFERQQKRRLSSTRDATLFDTLKNGNSSPESTPRMTSLSSITHETAELGTSSPPRFMYESKSKSSLNIKGIISNDRPMALPGPFVASDQSPGQTIDACLRRQTRQVDEFALPIVGMSANSDSYSKDCALQAGMNLFLAKPFTIGELQSVLGLFTNRAKMSKDISLEA